jgi:hypothetical protein
MSQESHGQMEVQPQILIQRLLALSFREQTRLLFQTTQHLSYKKKAEILGAGGSQLLQKRFLPLVLELLYKHFIKGAIWSVISVILVIFCLVVLGYLVQANPTEIRPVFFTVIAYLVGFFLAALFRVYQDIHQLIRKTLSKAEYIQILRTVQELEQANQIVVLRTLSMHVSQFGSEGSLLSPFLTEIALLIGAALVAGLIILLSMIRIPAGISASFLLLIAIILGFSIGFCIRHILHMGVSASAQRRQNKKARRA